METARSLNGRLGKLEEQVMERRVRAAAVRIGAEINCPPDVLIADAERLADLVELHGRDRAVGLVAAEIGITPEELEAASERFKAMLY